MLIPPLTPVCRFSVKALIAIMTTYFLFIVCCEFVNYFYGEAPDASYFVAYGILLIGGATLLYFTSGLFVIRSILKKRRADLIAFISIILFITAAVSAWGAIGEVIINARVLLSKAACQAPPDTKNPNVKLCYRYASYPVFEYFILINGVDLPNDYYDWPEIIKEQIYKDKRSTPIKICSVVETKNFQGGLYYISVGCDR